MAMHPTYIDDQVCEGLALVLQTVSRGGVEGGGEGKGRLHEKNLHDERADVHLVI